MNKIPSANPLDWDLGPASESADRLNAASISEQERLVRRQVHRLAEFYRHALTYVVVMSGVWFICLLSMRQFSSHWWAYWAIWPTLGWGIGLFFHGVFAVPSWQKWGHDWEERKVRELMDKQSKRP
jgi:2TM domain